jgi:hypothetical protein
MWKEILRRRERYGGYSETNFAWKVLFKKWFEVETFKFNWWKYLWYENECMRKNHTYMLIVIICIGWHIELLQYWQNYEINKWVTKQYWLISRVWWIIDKYHYNDIMVRSRIVSLKDVKCWLADWRDLLHGIIKEIDNLKVYNCLVSFFISVICKINIQYKWFEWGI